MESRCRYTRINGARCTMPTLNGRDLCYQHEERKRLARLKRKILPEPNTTGPLVSFIYMDDHASIIANQNAIAEAFANHQIDFRQVTALTYLMQTCLKTLRQMHELETEVPAEEAIREVTYDETGLPLAPTATFSNTYTTSANKPPVINHLSKPPQPVPSFSNTCALPPSTRAEKSRRASQNPLTCQLAMPRSGADSPHLSLKKSPQQLTIRPHSEIPAKQRGTPTSPQIPSTSLAHLNALESQ